MLMNNSSPGRRGKPLLVLFTREVAPTKILPILLEEDLIVTPFCSVAEARGLPAPETLTVAT